MAIRRALPVLDEQPDRWEAQLRKGVLEMAALASLWQGRLYGLEIIRFLESHSQLILAEGTIYPILNRLKAEGLLTSEWVEAEAGHPRKYYSLSDAGRQRLRLMTEAWSSFANGVSRLLEPVLEKQEKQLMTAEIEIENYLTALRLHLGPHTIVEREEIVREIGAHIRDSAEESGATLRQYWPAWDLPRNWPRSTGKGCSCARPAAASHPWCFCAPH